jgi:tetratricopeptide (TPR) repeat protein
MHLMRIGIFLLSFFLLFAGSASADQKDPRLASLFNQLSKVRSPVEAGALTMQIAELWRASGSDTADLLMDRAAASIEQQDYDTALKLLNAVIQMKPEYAEVHYRRADLFLRMDSTEQAAADLARAVALEPRDFRAHALIGSIADDAGQFVAALAAYRRALDLNPTMDGVIKRANELSDLARSRTDL